MLKNSNNDISYNVPRLHKTGVNNPKNDAFTQAKSEFAIWYNRITVRKRSAANLENRRKMTVSDEEFHELQRGDALQ